MTEIISSDSLKEPPYFLRNLEDSINKELKELDYTGRVEISHIGRNEIRFAYLNKTEKFLIFSSYRRDLPIHSNVPILIKKIKETIEKVSVYII